MNSAWIKVGQLLKSIKGPSVVVELPISFVSETLSSFQSSAYLPALIYAVLFDHTRIRLSLTERDGLIQDPMIFLSFSMGFA